MRDVTRTDWKIYDPKGQFVAATKHAFHAAVLVDFMGNGAQIKYKHHTLVWTEGKEEFRAGTSWGRVADLCFDRVNESRREAVAKRDGHEKKTYSESVK